MHYRRAIAAAQSIGAIYWVHFNLIWLGLAANGAGDVRADDLRTMSAGLRAQRDAGDELDQWLILVGAALALNGFLGPELAADVQQGIQSSAWAHGLPGQLIPLSIPDITAETPPSASPLELPALVDRVIEAIDDVLANWETATESARPAQ